MSGHILRVRLDDDQVKLSIECLEADGADCRRSCQSIDTCDDGYCIDPENHLEPVDFCNPLVWLEESCNYEGPTHLAEHYLGRHALGLHDGMAVTLEWDAEHEQYGWRPS
jgi:hypothetical protein